MASRSSVRTFTVLAAIRNSDRAKIQDRNIKNWRRVDESTPRVAATKSVTDQQKQTRYLVSPDMGRFLTFIQLTRKQKLHPLHGQIGQYLRSTQALVPKPTLTFRTPRNKPYLFS